MNIALARLVKMLEARFHPASKSSRGFVIVGRIHCDQHPASIERAAISPGAAKPFDSAQLYEKLEFLVTSVARNPRRELLELRSGFWSFVELPDTDDDRGIA
jgi:hypothetical protein